MPKSEAWRDAPAALRRVRFAGFNDSVGNVLFVAGVAQSGMPARDVERLRGCGLPIEDLGTWSDVTPSEPASLASEPPPSTDAGDAAPDLPSDPAEPAPADDAPSAIDTAPKPRKAPR